MQNPKSILANASRLTKAYLNSGMLYKFNEWLAEKSAIVNLKESEKRKRKWKIMIKKKMNEEN